MGCLSPLRESRWQCGKMVSDLWLNQVSSILDFQVFNDFYLPDWLARNKL